ncbi:3-oxo-5-alpha-steroid 4-dehydrogenase-domain-containing protein [Geopyxis carbonaria]|nr:3-oxo-5-alpha-steroid 4-dehydrogenase-domain-containing protein [Geopyxis carbonaria]
MDHLTVAIETASTHLASTLETLRSNGLLPLSHHNWSVMLTYWKYFTLVAPVQLLLDWYPMGKTSLPSVFNLPGKPAWVTMEIISPISLVTTLYTVSSTTSQEKLPPVHLLLTVLYLMHYFHRAILSPLSNPSMAPVHALLTLGGIAFNIINGAAIGGWLGGYGSAANVPQWQVALGCIMFITGLWGNMYHEEVLRDIRRQTEDVSMVKPDKDTAMAEDGRVYKVPRGGLFEYVWYPHYFSEWIEWTGFMIAGGGPIVFLPATLFLVNELATMIPRALQGKRWYEKKFGSKAPKRKAGIPWVL